jgi:hypothetical protein
MTGTEVVAALALAAGVLAAEDLTPESGGLRRLVTPAAARR